MCNNKGRQGKALQSILSIIEFGNLIDTYFLNLDIHYETILTISLY